jgi:hypothetical protein
LKYVSCTHWCVCSLYLVAENIIKRIDKKLYALTRTYQKYNSWVSVQKEIDASVADRYMVVED